MAKIEPSLVSGHVMDDCEHLASLCCCLRGAKSALPQYGYYQKCKFMCFMQNEAHQNEMFNLERFFQIHTRIWVALALRTQSY